MRSHHFLYTFAAGDLFFAVMNFFQGMYGVGILVALAGIGALLWLITSSSAGGLEPTDEPLAAREEEGTRKGPECVRTPALPSSTS